LVQRKTDGLGQHFLDRVDQALDRIALNPAGYPKIAGENRRCNLERFPYALWFKIENDAVVVACLHAKRSPAIAKERGENVIEMPKPESPSFE
jgi:hypothetical protein